jgi:hypothetical protein
MNIFGQIFAACVLVLAAILMPKVAHASCIRTGPSPGSAQQIEHKLLHTAVNAGVVYGTAYFTDSVWGGVLVATGMSLAREVEKATTPGMRCEWSSMAFDAAGIGLGAWASFHFIIDPRQRSISVSQGF